MSYMYNQTFASLGWFTLYPRLSGQDSGLSLQTEPDPIQTDSGWQHPAFHLHFSCTPGLGKGVLDCNWGEEHVWVRKCQPGITPADYGGTASPCWLLLAPVPRSAAGKCVNQGRKLNSQTLSQLFKNKQISLLDLVYSCSFSMVFTTTSSFAFHGYLT